MNNQSIKNEDITFVIQGYVGNKAEVKQGLASIRKVMPGSPIILSTWEGSDISELEFDEVILSPDPGPLKYGTKVIHTYTFSTQERMFSINRQIQSGKLGLAKVKTKYVFFTRTGMYLNHDGFRNYIDKYNDYDMQYKAFESRVLIVSDWTTISDTNTLFHPADLAYCGYTNDIKKFYDQDLVDQNDMVPIPDDPNHRSMRFESEQYLFVNALKNSDHNIPFTDKYQHSPELKQLYLQYIANNLVVVGWADYGIGLSKKELYYLTLRQVIRSECCDHNGWLKLYQTYANGHDINEQYDQQQQQILRQKLYTRLKTARRWAKLQSVVYMYNRALRQEKYQHYFFQNLQNDRQLDNILYEIK